MRRSTAGSPRGAAVGDSGAAQNLIRTFPRKGVRFIGEVREENKAAAPAPELTAEPRPELALPEKPSIAVRRRFGTWIHSRAALPLLALVCTTVAIAAAIAQWSRPAAPNTDSGRAIIVTPFRNQVDGAAHASLGEAIAERIAVELARLPATRIIGQNTAAAYADRPMDSRQLNRELRVRLPVDGSVTSTGGAVRVEAALVDAAADAVRWSDHFDFAEAQSPQLEDDIVTLIIRPLVLVLMREEANRAAAKESAEQTADDLVWRGWEAAFGRPLSQADQPGHIVRRHLSAAGHCIGAPPATGHRGSTIGWSLGANGGGAALQSKWFDR